MEKRAGSPGSAGGRYRSLESGTVGLEPETLSLTDAVGVHPAFKF
jgi:hypothetical protein